MSFISVDCWSLISSFCDVKEQGNLQCVSKSISNVVSLDENKKEFVYKMILIKSFFKDYFNYQFNHGNGYYQFQEMNKFDYDTYNKCYNQRQDDDRVNNSSDCDWGFVDVLFYKLKYLLNGKMYCLKTNEKLLKQYHIFYQNLLVSLI